MFDADLADGLLRGAGAIATFLRGDDRPAYVCEVYRLAIEVAPDRRIPTFKLGAILCARRSTLLAWIAAQERASGPGEAE